MEMEMEQIGSLSLKAFKLSHIYRVTWKPDGLIKYIQTQIV